MTTTKNPKAPATTKSGKPIYLKNKDLLEEVKRCKQTGVMSDTLARMLQLLCAKYAKKGNYVNYTYNEDMQAYAMLMLVRTWASFNPEKSSNPFAFYTQCIKHSLIQYLNQEKRHRMIRDTLLVEQGLDPSFSFQESYSDSHIVDDEEDYQHLQQIHHETNSQLESEAVSDAVDTESTNDSTQ